MDVTERRRQVYALKMRGYSTGRISNLLKIPEITVKRDLDRHLGEVEAVTQRLTADQYAIQMRAENQIMREEAWRKYDESTRDLDRIKYLNYIKGLRESELLGMQKLGVLEQQTKRVEHSHHHEIEGTVLAEMTDTRLDALAAMLIASNMEVTAEEAMIMRGREPDMIEAHETEPLALPEPVEMLPAIPDSGTEKLQEPIQ